MLITNYITSAWRNILRHKLFSIINIMGLAIGLAAVMLIALYVRYETSYDNFWKNSGNIYRIHNRMDVPGKDPQYYNGVTPLLAEAIKKNFPEIDEVARLVDIKETIIIDHNNFELSLALVDPDILNIFDFKTVYGDLNYALNDKSSLVLDQSQAKKFFGDTNPVGKSVTIKFFDHIKDYKISAVIQDPPENTVMQVHGMVVLAEEDYKVNLWSAWYDNFTQTFVTISNKSDVQKIDDNLPQFIDNNYPALSFGPPGTKPSTAVHLSLMNVENLHFDARGDYETVPRGNKNNVIVFTLVALLILIIAAINFMNLTTARASQRAKEVSLRKVMGAKRENLMVQFLSEALLIALFALVIAFMFVEISLPFYSKFIGINLTLDYFSFDILCVLIFTMGIGLAGGIYPSFILSNFRPANILHSNKSNDTHGSIRFRTLLVAIQFTISITLFVSTAVIFSQIIYVNNMNIGYERENLLSIEGDNLEKLNENIEIIINRFNKIKGVSNVTYTANFKPGTKFTFTQTRPLRAKSSDVIDPVLMTSRSVGYDFLKTFGIPLITGRDFDRNHRDQRPTNEQLEAGERYTASIILNKSAVRRLGLGTPEQAIGKMLYMNVGSVSDDGGQKKLETELSVIGVIDDVHLTDLRSEVLPEFYQLTADQPLYVILRYSGDPMDVVNQARNIWREQMPGVSFGFNFATDSFAQQYAEEQNQMIMFAAFSGLAIFIACLGLFGLASFTAERRTKEIGIRKVFGAEVWQIVKLLVWQFSKPVLIANIIAWPIAYLAMSRWLESFVYRIDDMVIIALCLMAGLTALLIAWATVAGNSYAVARQNPIKALRYE
ncbi:MAG: FtsX-like permease family protein [Emcibacteraceae bacterium]